MEEEVTCGARQMETAATPRRSLGFAEVASKPRRIRIRRRALALRLRMARPPGCRSHYSAGSIRNTIPSELSPRKVCSVAT